MAKGPSYCKAHERYSLPTLHISTWLDKTLKHPVYSQWSREPNEPTNRYRFLCACRYLSPQRHVGLYQSTFSRILNILEEKWAENPFDTI